MQFKCLSIAGFDGSGGAGMQADLKTFAATGSYGMNVLTALPVQNTTGVKSCYNIPLQCITEQLECIFSDLKPNAIKIGMLFSADIINLVAEFLADNAQNIPIVLDPVMVSKSGHVLLQENAIETLIKKMIPIAEIITPNIPEAKKLLRLNDSDDIIPQKLLELGSKAVLLKGGHANNTTCDDIYISHNIYEVLSLPRINTKNTHGTGCTLSAAIASFLAQKNDLLTACRKSKEYLYQAINSNKNNLLGSGNGPVDHFFNLKPYPVGV